MPLWGNRDFPSGNNKPKYANTANVFGANTAEARAAGKGVHPGWTQFQWGTGGIAGVNIVWRGGGYNANGYVAFTSVDGRGSGANASFIAKSNNANATDNVILQIVVNNPGSGYTRPPTATANLSNSNTAILSVIPGGRMGRPMIETLVAMNDLSGSANTFPL